MQTKDPIEKKAVIYCRVARDNEMGSQLRKQVRNCIDYAKANSYSVERIFSERGSGRKRNRQALQQLLRFCLDHKADNVTIISRDLERFSRNMDALQQLLYRLRKYNVQLAFMDGRAPFEH